eukprot:2522390-Prymnesium_polylepis.1
MMSFATRYKATLSAGLPEVLGAVKARSKCARGGRTVDPFLRGSRFTMRCWVKLASVMRSASDSSSLASECGRPARMRHHAPPPPRSGRPTTSAVVSSTTWPRMGVLVAMKLGTWQLE